MFKKIFKIGRFGAVNLVKGAVPGGDAVINTIEHFTGKDLATGDLKNVNWSKTVLRLVGAGIMVYLFVSKTISVEELIKFIKNYL